MRGLAARGIALEKARINAVYIVFLLLDSVDVTNFKSKNRSKYQDPNDTTLIEGGSVYSNIHVLPGNFFSNQIEIVDSKRNFQGKR